MWCGGTEECAEWCENPNPRGRGDDGEKGFFGRMFGFIGKHSIWFIVGGAVVGLVAVVVVVKIIQRRRDREFDLDE
jgi:hypothetical protein